LVLAISSYILRVEVVGAFVWAVWRCWPTPDTCSPMWQGWRWRWWRRRCRFGRRLRNAPGGYRRAEVLAAAVQAGLLLAVGVFILVEGVRRLIEPPQIQSRIMFALA
jgi:Cation efflux family